MYSLFVYEIPPGNSMNETDFSNFLVIAFKSIFETLGLVGWW